MNKVLYRFFIIIIIIIIIIIRACPNFFFLKELGI